MPASPAAGEPGRAGESQKRGSLSLLPAAQSGWAAEASSLLIPTHPSPTREPGETE